MRFLRRAHSASSVVNQALDASVDAHHHQLDAAVESTVRHHREGDDDAVVLSETMVAVRAAKALEMLTGIDWDEHLQARATGVAPERPAPRTGFAKGSPRAPGCWGLAEQPRAPTSTLRQPFGVQEMMAAGTLGRGGTNPSPSAMSHDASSPPSSERTWRLEGRRRWLQ